MSKMKESPFKLLVCVVDKGKADIAKAILKNAKEPNYLEFLSEGITLAKFVSVMGGNRRDTSVLTGLVRSDNALRTVQGLDLILCPDEKHSYGVVFTISLNSMNREMLNYFLSKQTEDNNVN